MKLGWTAVILYPVVVTLSWFRISPPAWGQLTETEAQAATIAEDYHLTSTNIVYLTASGSEWRNRLQP